MLDADTRACAAIVERGDPFRFRTVMAAPVSARRVLFPLYAFNVEVSRAPWVTQEPMIAEMRLQWWRDALDEIAKGGPVRRHEVATPLAALLSPEDAHRLDALVAARIWDCHKDPFEDAQAFDAYIDATAGNLMQTAARLLGDLVPGTRDLALATGLAAWFRAIPALETSGRKPLVDGRPEAVAALARSSLDRLAQAPRRAGPAHWPAIGARQTLHQATKDPNAVADGRLDRGLTSFRLLKASILKRI